MIYKEPKINTKTANGRVGVTFLTKDHIKDVL